MSFNKLAFVGKIIDKILPDEHEALAAKTRMLELDQEGGLSELDDTVAAEVTAGVLCFADTKNNSKFQSWWRPTVGWVCVCGLAYAPALACLSWLVSLCVWFSGTPLDEFPQPPEVDNAALVVILGSLLGVGGLRTFERHKRHTTWGKG